MEGMVQDRLVALEEQEEEEEEVLLAELERQVLEEPEAMERLAQ
jgi:hypothetical protein